jgi:hypothetical protein
MRVTTATPRIGARTILRLYPAEWRSRYEVEVADLLDERPLTMADRWDLLRGAADAHLHPGRPSRLPPFAALAGGALWLIVGLTVLVQPVPPDWPGYLIETVPLAFVGALLVGLALVGAWLRLGDALPGASHVALGIALAGHVLWAVSVAMTLAGMDYGATTAIAQTAAGAGTLFVAVLLTRIGDWRMATILLAAGLALLLPHPASWLAFGIAWTGAGLARTLEILPKLTASGTPNS